jgi:hypothetical protein
MRIQNLHLSNEREGKMRRRRRKKEKEKKTNRGEEDPISQQNSLDIITPDFLCPPLLHKLGDVWLYISWNSQICFIHVQKSARNWTIENFLLSCNMKRSVADRRPSPGM